MNTIKFKNFLDSNDLKLEQLPEPIMDKAILFERLYDILEDIQQPDRGELLEQLEFLDLEILEDIEQHLQQHLQDNDRLEVLATSDTIPKPLARKAAKKLKTDESILEELVKIKRTKNIGRSTLRDLGFKAPLSNNLVIGNYVLKRSFVFLYLYDIIPLKRT